MKSTALTLLVTLLCAETAQGLLCYECQNYTSVSACRLVSCCFAGKDGYCTSVDATFETKSIVLKMKYKLCLAVCLEGANMETMLEDGKLNTRITCCRRDFCNAGALVGGNAWTLVGGLLFSLGLAFLPAPL